MFEFLTRTVEFQHFGWNIATVGASGTMFFTCWQLWALWHQYTTIKTGEAVSVRWHTYFAADFLAFIFYGMYAASIAMTFNAFLGFGHLLVLWRLWKVKEFTTWERRLLPILIMFPVLMFFSRTYSIDFWFIELTERQLLFLLFSIGTVVALGMQPWEMWRSHSRGDVSFRLLFTYTAATGFWVTFAFFATGDVVLRFLTVTAGAELVLSLVLWYRYRPEPASVHAE